MKLRGLKDQRLDEHSSYRRLDWVFPVAQLFHMQMLLAKAILLNYRGSTNEQGSLEQLATMLRRKRIFCDNPEIHAMDEFLRRIFTAMILRLWEVSVGAEEMQSLDNYSDNSAFNDCINVKVMEVIDRDLTAPNIENTSSRNATLFLRDMIMYMELFSAIKIGHIGRIEKALRWLTIIFHAGFTPHYAGFTPHYAYELMRFRCCFKYVWDEHTKVAVLSSMLANKSRRHHGWKPTDLYQEHHNRSIKHVYYSRRGETPFDMSRERVSTSIETFDNVKEQMEKQFQAPSNKRKHAAVFAETDIHDIMRILRENETLSHNSTTYVRKNERVTTAKDLLLAGTSALQDAKRIRVFIDKHSYDGQGLGDDFEDRAQESNPADTGENHIN